MRAEDYIRGARDRAAKVQPSGTATADYLEGYEWMCGALAPVEQEIVAAALKYRSVARARLLELEEKFRDSGDAGVPAADPAGPALQSE